MEASEKIETANANGGMKAVAPISPPETEKRSGDVRNGLLAIPEMTIGSLCGGMSLLAVSLQEIPLDFVS